MFRIDDPSNTAILPAPLAAGTPGYFSRGNPSGGIRPTVLSVDWANTIQEELMKLLLDAGLTPNKADLSQVKQALDILYNPGRLINVFRPTSNGAISLNAATNWCRCILIGAGGGGGGTEATGVGESAAGGGGGSGGYLEVIVPAATIDGEVYAMGPAGSGGIGIATPATAGGISLIGDLWAYGGAAGASGNAEASAGVIGGAPPGGVPNVTTGATTVIANSESGGGEAGLIIAPGTAFGQMSGKGGNGPYGGAGHNKTAAAGGDGKGPGAGGGGAASGPSSAARNGGAGQVGMIVVYEYT